MHWNQIPELLLQCAQRLKMVQIENRPAVNVIKRFRNPNVLIYKWRQSATFISVRWAWVNAALLLLLILNVFFHHCQAVFTYRCNEVAV